MKRAGMRELQSGDRDPTSSQLELSHPGRAKVQSSKGPGWGVSTDLLPQPRVPRLCVPSPHESQGPRRRNRRDPTGSHPSCAGPTVGCNHRISG